MANLRMWILLWIIIHMNKTMKTIQMTIDEPLLAEIDQLIERLHINRSAFIRAALQKALKNYKTLEKEKQHAEGYIRFPVQPGEFDVWETEQVWGDE